MPVTRLLQGSMISPYVRKVLMVLRQKQLEFELEELIPFLPAHKHILLTRNPLGKVPIYQEGDFVISDSSVICAYLEKQYPHPSIFPADAEQFANCLWYEEYADTQLIPTIATVFFQTQLATRFNLEVDHAGVKAALEIQLPALFDFLDKAIGGKQYLLGNTLTLADISLISPFINFEFAGYSVNAMKWKNLARYIDQLSREPLIAHEFAASRERWARRS